MKIRASIAAVAALGMVVAVGSPAGAASKVTAKVMMTGDCADGEMLEGTDEDDCQVMVSKIGRASCRERVLRLV